MVVCAPQRAAGLPATHSTTARFARSEHEKESQFMNIRSSTVRATTLPMVVVGMLALGACASPEGNSGQDKAEEGAKLPDRVTLVIPYGEGGGTDVWARFMAPHLTKAVEGGPTFTPENRPGGESITGSNQFVATGGSDGSQLLVTSGTTYFQYLLGRKEVEFDFAKMRPLMLNGTGGAIYVSKSASINSIADLKSPKTPLSYGGISPTGLDLSTLLAFDLLGLDVKATFGFEGRGPARLALERGEVNIDYQTTSAFKSQVEPMIEKGQAVPLMSFGQIDESGKVVRDPAFPDLPTVEEAYKEIKGEEPSGAAYDAYKAFLAAGYPFQKGLWANAGTPDSIAQPFWDAAEKLQDDKAFQTEGKKVLGGYPLYSGRKVKDQVADAFDISEEARAHVLKVLEEKYDTKVDTK
jgi:tripartite-type tricarboxylate transporter receptor subunit TctC